MNPAFDANKKNSIIKLSSFLILQILEHFPYILLDSKDLDDILE